MCIRISNNLHNMLYEGVVRAKMSFFHKNSSGRILNRFSKDIGSIDNVLPVVLVDTLIVSIFVQFASHTFSTSSLFVVFL